MLGLKLKKKPRKQQKKKGPAKASATSKVKGKGGPKGGTKGEASGASARANSKNKANKAREQSLRRKGREQRPPEPDPPAGAPTLEELYEQPKRTQLVRLFVWLIAASAVIGLLAVVFIMLVISTGGFGAAQQQAAPPPPAPVSDRELATSTAENFSAAYLTLSTGESDTGVQDRLAKFLAPEAAPEAIAPKTGGEVSREVLSSAAWDARALRDGRWVVYTRNTVKTLPTGEQSGDEGDTELPTVGAEEETVKTVGLEVFVGVKDGTAGVVAAPSMIRPPATSFDGPYGAIFTENQEPLNDSELIAVLEGYFDALYGTDESQATLDRFFIDGAPRPALPDPDLDYVDLSDGWVYPVGGSGDAAGGFAEAYDVEATVEVADEAARLTANQTHLLRVRREGDSWAIAGTTKVVGQRPAPARSNGDQ